MNTEAETTETGNDLPLLFTPMTMRGVTTKIRIVVSPLCQYHSDDGGPTDWQMTHIGRFAVGGAGIIFGEETGVEARCRKTYSCAGIWDDKHIAQYRRITDFIRAQNAVPAIQLGHAGRKASCHAATKNWEPLAEEDAKDGLAPWQGLAPSALDQLPRCYTPKAMDKDDIRTVLDSWREATRRSMDAGYDICEIHGAHGYLIHQFLSPVSNHRTDSYGGDREGRMRFALEVIECVRAVWPDHKPLFLRLSVEDDAGWGPDENVRLARLVREMGIDVIDCSSGGIRGAPVVSTGPVGYSYQVPYAEKLRAEADIKTMAVGLIVHADQAERILQEGRADLIAIAREALHNPNWPLDAALKLGVDEAYDLMPSPYRYWLSKRASSVKDLTVSTAVDGIES